MRGMRGPRGPKGDKGDSLNGTATGTPRFFANHGSYGGTDANVLRFRDRIFVGAASDYSGYFPASVPFTVTIGSPAICTATTPTPSGLANGQRIRLSTTGVLPTGLSIATDYYIVNASGATFELAATYGGTPINTSGTQSGSHTASGWLEQAIHYSQQNAQFAAISTEGYVGLLGASRTSDNPTPNAQSSVGGWFAAINDNITQVQYAYGIYAEAQRKAGAGWTATKESDIVNFGSVVDLSPYNPYVADATVNHWLASGGGHPGAGRASAALGVVSNPDPMDPTTGKYARGIVFAANAIYGADGQTGSGIAVSMAKGHQLSWGYASAFGGSETQTAYIMSEASSTTYAMGVDFTNDGLLFRHVQSSAPALYVVAAAADRNYAKIASGATGVGPTLFALGLDTDVDLNLIPQGGGSVKVGGALSMGGIGSSKEIAVGMTNVFARLRERAAVNQFAINTNMNIANTQDDNTKSSWQMDFGSGTDSFNISRAAPGGGLTPLISVDPTGVIAAPIFKTKTPLITTTGTSTPIFGTNFVGGAGGPTNPVQAGWLEQQDSTGAPIYLGVWK